MSCTVPNLTSSSFIKAIDSGSVHHITSGQVVIDLQTAVKELVENALDAGATSVEVKFKDHGVTSIEVVDNGSGIAPEDYDSVALKHHTSKLSSFADLTTVLTFGFRGEALSSLCAVCEKVSIITSTAESAPVGTILELSRSGVLVSSSGRAARQRGTTITLSGLFAPLPVRRKEFERHAKRELARALTILQGYALVPCSNPDRPVRLTVSGIAEKGKKTVHLKTTGTSGVRGAASALWGPKALDSLVDLDLSFEVAWDRHAIKRLKAVQGEAGDPDKDDHLIKVEVKGLISKFALGCGRSGTDRQYFFVNGRPCVLPKVQKVFNDVYRAFNVNQTPLVIADLLIPTSNVDVNVSPDKRTLFLHSEQNLLEALKAALEERFATSRSTYDINGSGTPPTGTLASTQATLSFTQTRPQSTRPSTPLQRTPAKSARLAKDSLPDAVSGEDDEERPDESQDALGSSRTRRGRSGTNTSEDGYPPAEDLPRSDELDEEDPAVDDTFETSPMGNAKFDYSNRSSSPPSLIGPTTPASVIQVRKFGRSFVLGSSSSTSSSPAPRSRLASSSSAMSASGNSSASSKRHKVHEPLFIDDSDEEAGVAPHEQEERVDEETPSSPEAMLSTQGVSWARHMTPSSGARDVPTKDKWGQKERLRAAGLHSRVSINSDNTDVDVEHLPEDTQFKPLTKTKRASPPTPPRIGSLKRAKLSAGAASFSKVDLIARTQSRSQSSEVEVGPLESEEGTQLGISSFAIEVDEIENVPTPAVDASDASEDAATLDFDLDLIQQRWNRRSVPSSHSVAPALASRTDAHAASLTSSDADSALSRTLSKPDFERMEILGQFNRGFIITRLNNDLWIVDQHAADEKYNFEDLQRNTRIRSQRLVRPQVLEMSAADEVVAREHVEVLRQNGFEIEVDEDTGGGEGGSDDVMQGASRHELKLVALPMSKDIVFDMHDIHEIIQLLHDRPQSSGADDDKTVVRCKKARAMFASRACRKSFMIGMPLKNTQMVAIIRHMGSMNNPWNCPHGRPTMRHLFDVETAKHRDNRNVDWSSASGIKSWAKERSVSSLPESNFLLPAT